MGFKFLTSTDGEYIRRRILLALTEDNRLHTEEVMRIWQMLRPDLEPAKLWDMAVNALTKTMPKAIAAALPFAAFQNINN